MPIWFHCERGAPMVFAGIWSNERADSENIDTCTVITRAANEHSHFTIDTRFSDTRGRGGWT